MILRMRTTESQIEQINNETKADEQDEVHKQLVTVWIVGDLRRDRHRGIRAMTDEPRSRNIDEVTTLTLWRVRVYTLSIRCFRHYGASVIDDVTSWTS